MPTDLERSLDAADHRLRQLGAEVAHQQRLATLGTAAALIVHEFKNLLTPLRAYAQMAAANPNDRELADRAISKAALCAEQASAIADAILEFVKPDADARQAESQTADVQVCLQRAIALLARPLESDQIALTSSIAAGMTAAIKAVALQHVLLNIILNSRAALLGRGGEIKVSANTLKGLVVIAICDDGPGMNMPGRDALKPFVGGGSGLGLAVCDRLIADAHGRIEINSSTAGTTVRLMMPSVPTTANEIERTPIDFQPA